MTNKYIGNPRKWMNKEISLMLSIIIVDYLVYIVVREWEERERMKDKKLISSEKWVINNLNSLLESKLRNQPYRLWTCALSSCENRCMQLRWVFW